MEGHLMILGTIWDLVVDLWQREPALIRGAAVALTVAGAGWLGLGVDAVRVEAIIAPILAVILVRRAVTPASGGYEYADPDEEHTEGQ
jgi:hypothetical protein